jgi:hypothetical protein
VIYFGGLYLSSTFWEFPSLPGYKQKRCGRGGKRIKMAGGLKGITHRVFILGVLGNGYSIKIMDCVFNPIFPVFQLRKVNPTF